MPMPDNAESYLRSLAHRFNEPDLRKVADEIKRLTAEVERLREARKEPIPIGVGKVLVGLAYDVSDPLKIEREVVIHQIGRTVPVGDEVPELANSSTDDLDVLARIRIDDPGGSWLLMEKLGQAIENARRALAGEVVSDAD